MPIKNLAETPVKKETVQPQVGAGSQEAPAQPIKKFNFDPTQANPDQTAGAAGFVTPDSGVMAGMTPEQLQEQMKLQQDSNKPQTNTLSQPSSTAQQPASQASGTPPGQANEIDKLYNDLLSQHEKSWADTQQALGSQAAAANRRAMATNASMGRGVAGGFLAGQGQAQLDSQGQFLQAKAQHDKEGRNILMQQMDQKLQDQRIKEGYAQQEKMQQAGFGQQTAMQEAGFGHQASMQEKSQQFQAAENSMSREHQSALQAAGFDFQAGQSQLTREQQTALQEAGFDHQAVQAELNRAFSSAEREASQDFAAGESALGREFSTGEREATQDFAAGESALSREFSAEQAQAQRDWQSGESQAGRDFTQSLTEKGWDREDTKAARDAYAAGRAEGLSHEDALGRAASVTGIDMADLEGATESIASGEAEDPWPSNDGDKYGEGMSVSGDTVTHDESSLTASKGELGLWDNDADSYFEFYKATRAPPDGTNTRDKKIMELMKGEGGMSYEDAKTEVVRDEMSKLGHGL